MMQFIYIKMDNAVSHFCIVKGEELHSTFSRQMKCLNMKFHSLYQSSVLPLNRKVVKTSKANEMILHNPLSQNYHVLQLHT